MLVVISGDLCDLGSMLVLILLIWLIPDGSDFGCLVDFGGGFDDWKVLF